MIVGSLHLYRTARAGLIGPGKQEKTEDITRFDYADADPLEVVKMLESVLTTVKQQIQASEQAKKDADVGKVTAERPLTGRQRRSHLIEDLEEEDED